MTLALRTAAAALGVAALGVVAKSDPNPAIATTTRLTAGLVLEREMATGETHTYAIELAAGEYLHVLVEQRGVDVVQTLTGPDGAVVVVTDSPCGFIGPDPVAIVAHRAGVYGLSLKADYAISPRGRYELSVDGLRQPGPEDLLRVKAVQAGAEGFRALVKGRGGALEPFRAAAGAWEAVGDRRMQMWAEIEVAFLYHEAFQQNVEAETWLVRVLATAVDLGDEWAEARIRFNLGRSQVFLGKLDEAKSNLDQSLALHRAAGREEDSANVLAELGRFHGQAAEPQTALDYLQEALQRFRAAGNERGEAITLITMGAVYLRLGDPELALEQYRSGVLASGRDPTYRTRTSGGLAVLRARSTIGMASAHRRQGDLSRAREGYEEGLAIYKTIGSPPFVAEALVGLGLIHQEQGELQAAREAFESAVAIYRPHAMPFLEGMAQCRVGEVYRRLDQAGAARQAFQAALATTARAGPLVKVCAEEGLARLGRDAGELEAARALAVSALGTLETARAAVASHSTRAAALESQQSLYELLIDVLMRKHEAEPSAGHDVAAIEVSERARARSLLELLGETRIDVRHGVAPDLLAEERSVRRRFNTAAAAQSEARSAGRAERVEALSADLDRLSAQLAETEARVRRASPQYAALTQAQPLTLVEIRARVLDSDTQLLQYALGEEQSFLWVVSAGRLDSFRLAPAAEIETAARRLHELMSATGPPSGPTRPPPVEAASRELTRLVLAPAAQALTARRLLVVAPGALQYVPLGSLALPDGTPVLARFELVSAPSASIIATLRKEAQGRGRAAKVVAVFADPVFEPSDPRLAAARSAAPMVVASRGPEPSEQLEHALRGARGTGAGGGLGRLPFSRQEADAIVALASATGALKATGFDATRDAATNPRLADYRIIHFATHGVLNARRPELSGVVLSLFDERGRKQDGFLRLHDVYNLRLDADLVVLSGCQTALGKDLKGEGLVGLTRGFMYAGARRVVASLWQVDDESTAELMKRFYRGMLKDGRRPAEALRTAQLEMSRHPRWSAPFHWAGFVLQGEWR